MKRLLSLVVGLLSLPLLATAAETGRERFRMDFGWRFTLGDPRGAEKATFEDSEWRALDVPHDWSIEGPWSKGNPSGSAGGYAPIGVGWYRKRFRLPRIFPAATAQQ